MTTKNSEKNRIQTKLAQLQKHNQKALTLFLTAGYPKRTSTVPLVLKLAESGADIIELGMPFSDPLADGPVIQSSSQQAIANGMTLEYLLEQASKIRECSDIPLIIMGYTNPILRYGEKKFFVDAKKAGIDGVILPEVPLEESPRFLAQTHATNLADILLVSPATTNDRIKKIDSASTGFLYCVSATGVTGRSNLGTIVPYIRRVKRQAKKNPVLVGFGIKTPEDARTCAQYSDGVIVGSALIQKIAGGITSSALGTYVRSLKNAL
jgi:tryptophan synthase alpha chain